MKTAVARQRRQFALVAFAVLAGGLGLVWFASDFLIGCLRPIAEWAARTTGLADAINPNAAGGWTVWTGLVIGAGPPELIGHGAGIVVEADTLRDLLRGLPLFLALMIAPPHATGSGRRLAIGLVLLLALAVLSVIAVINCHLAIIVDHRTSPVDAKMIPPNFSVLAPAYGDLWFFIASLGFYLSVQVIPLIAPVLLWVLLKPEAMAMLMRPLGSSVTSVPAEAAHD